MSCAVIEQSEPVLVEPGSQLSQWVGKSELEETYHCSFALNPDYEAIFNGSEFRVAARAKDGAIRAMELVDKSFFLGTAFQPERAAFQKTRHPVVSAFTTAMLATVG